MSYLIYHPKRECLTIQKVAKMQFTEMSKIERTHLIKGLLKYCELDTLAMVMIYEFWLDEMKK